MKKLTIVLMTMLVMASCSAESRKNTGKDSADQAESEEVRTPVEKYGALKIHDHRVSDRDGNPVQLKGVSFAWHNWWPRFYSPRTVAELADWGASVVRASIGVAENNCFDSNPEFGYRCVDSVVEGAVNKGIYAIVDFHAHPDKREVAKEFFSAVSKKYAGVPNVIYEIWNEPVDVSWEQIKSYAAEVIPEIRKNSPDALILVGTPHWDQDVDIAAESPLAGYGNVAYTLHFYAATHKDTYRKKAETALKKGLPLFISECASMEASGDGPMDMESWQEWMRFADSNKISWVAWSLADKNETCSMLYPTASSDGLEWTDKDYKPWAKAVREWLKK